MKVCYISNSFKEHDHKFLSKLSEENIKTFAVSMSKTILSDDYKFDNIHYFELSAYYPKLSNQLLNNSFLKLFLYPLWFFLAYRLSVQIINKSKPDILHGGYVPIVGFLCSIINFRPFLLMPWGSDILIFSR